MGIFRGELFRSTQIGREQEPGKPARFSMEERAGFGAFRIPDEARLLG
jgi:hypothetical protein